MSIRKIEIEGYKSVSSLKLENVSPLLAFAGANGSGKSNVVDALAFFGAVVRIGAAQARTQFGGFSQIHCFKHRLAKRTTASLSIAVILDGSEYDYSLCVSNLDADPKVTESLTVDGISVIDRADSGRVEVRFDRHAPGTQMLPGYPDGMTALMLMGKSPLYAFLSNIRVFRFDPIAAKEPSVSKADDSELDAHGRNVAPMLQSLQKDSERQKQVLEWLALIVPGMESVATETQRLDGSTVITFKEKGTKARFPAQLVSDGTVYTLCILTAMLSRSSGTGITIIEEPERGMHPKAIGAMIDLMRANASSEHPIFLTTHSESVVRNLLVEELLLAGKQDGKTQINPVDDRGIDWKEITLDAAWMCNLLDGGLPW
ncbi:AAA family ATPase [Gluconobacter kondonii]|uniref:AAA family ATPase n=1 Tax=Gluconobacter kondonii TaxID=941463 RepID=UPI001B8AACB7|nr:ATP-binding protein [Gluconobacter kondonii]MBS1084457.1 AAA family ATPase [Gluconobacter kondonii]